MFQTKSLKLLPVMLLLCILLTACSNSTKVAPTPITHTTTRQPGLTPTLTPSPTQIPTLTPTLTPSPTQTPTLTPTIPTNTPTASPTPTLTSTPVQLAYEAISVNNFDRLSIAKYLGSSGSLSFIEYSNDQQYIFLATDHEFCKYNSTNLMLIDCFRLPNAIYEGGYIDYSFRIVGISPNQSYIYKFETKFEPGYNRYILQLINPLDGELIRVVSGNLKPDYGGNRFVCSTVLDNQDVVGVHDNGYAAFYGIAENSKYYYRDHSFPENGCLNIVHGRKGVALVGNDGIDIYSDSKTTIAHIKGRREHVSEISYSPDEKYLAVVYNPETIYGSGSGLLVIYRTEDYLPVLEEFSSWPIRDVAFSPDGDLMSYVSSGKSVNIYKTNTWERTNTLYAESEYGYEKIIFSPDANYLLISSGLPKSGRRERDSYFLWDLKGGRSSPQRIIQNPDDFWAISPFPIQADFSAASNSLVYLNKAGMTVLDVVNNEVLNSDCLRSYSQRFSPDGKHLAIGTGRISFLDLTSGEIQSFTNSPIGSTEGCESAIVDVAYSPDNKQMAALSWNGERKDSIISVIDVDSGEIQFSDHMTYVVEPGSIAFSKDGTLLAASVPGSTLNIYETDNFTKLLGMINAPEDIVFSSDNKYLLGNISETVYVYDVSECFGSSTNSTNIRGGCGNILSTIDYGKEKLQLFTENTIISMGIHFYSRRNPGWYWHNGDYKEPDTYKLWSLPTGELTEFPLDYIPQTVDEISGSSVYTAAVNQVIVSLERGILLLKIFNGNGNHGWALVDPTTHQYTYRNTEDFLYINANYDDDVISWEDYNYGAMFDSISPDGKFILSLYPFSLWAIK